MKVGHSPAVFKALASSIAALMLQAGPPPIMHQLDPPPFGASKRTVAQDRRAAKKRRAVKRARKLGHA